MARPTKQGIDYFPLDVDFFQDEKIRRIMKACGVGSPTILLSLLCNIYRKNGYYIEWDDRKPFLIADEVGVSEGTVIEVVNKALQVGFFSNELMKEKKILTSAAIQKRFVEATTKRKLTDINPDYWLIEGEKGVNSVNNPVNDVNNRVNDGNNPQSKVKESKVIKDLRGDADAPPRKREAKEFEREGIPYKCSKYLAEKILLLNPNAKAPKDDVGLFKWCKHIDLLIRIDKKPDDELWDVLTFAVKDPFWSTNILSTESFRARYDQLFAKMKSQRGENPNVHNWGYSQPRDTNETDPYKNITSTRL